MQTKRVVRNAARDPLVRHKSCWVHKPASTSAQISESIEEEAAIMTRYCFIGWFIATVAVSLGPDRAFSEPPMELDSKIPLGDVSGRIDHLAIDLPRRRLFVAELGNNTVGVVDLNDRK